MKFLFDIFPVILFFAAFKLYGIYIATTVAIVATVLQIAWVWVKHRKVENMQSGADCRLWRRHPAAEG